MEDYCAHYSILTNSFATIYLVSTPIIIVTIISTTPRDRTHLHIRSPQAIRLLTHSDLTGDTAVSTFIATRNTMRRLPDEAPRFFPQLRSIHRVQALNTRTSTVYHQLAG